MRTKRITPYSHLKSGISQPGAQWDLNPLGLPTGGNTMLLHTKKIGALVRCFAREQGLVDNAVKLALASVERMLSVTVGNRPFVSRVEILIPVDSDYIEKDCGETAAKLCAAISKRQWKGVFVSEVKHGDIFVGLLNYGMAKLLRNGCDYGIVLSKEAESYFTTEAAEDLLQAAEAGALAAGLAITELTESIMQGRIANTFAIWHLMSLVQVGCFDLRSAKAKKEAPIKSRAEAWDSGKGHWSYDLAGVEEIVPLIRLMRTFGPCIAPVLPRGDNVLIWKAPDSRNDPEGYIRHVNKLGTKFVRQSHFADQEHADLSFLQGAVMEAYRHPDYIK